MDSTPIGTNTTNAKISHFDLTHVGTKTSVPKQLTLPTEFPKRKEKQENSTYQRNWIQNRHHQTHHRDDLICLMIANKANLKARYVIKGKAPETQGTGLVRLIV